MNPGTPENVANNAYQTSAGGHFDPENGAPPLLQVQGLAHRYALPRTRLWGPRPQLPGQQPAEPALALPDEPTRFGAAAMRLWGPLLAAERRGGR